MVTNVLIEKLTGVQQASTNSCKKFVLTVFPHVLTACTQMTKLALVNGVLMVVSHVVLLILAMFVYLIQATVCSKTNVFKVAPMVYSCIHGPKINALPVFNALIVHLVLSVIVLKINLMFAIGIVNTHHLFGIGNATHNVQ